MQRNLLMLVLILAASVVRGEEIPLQSVWGLNIAGTKNVKDLVPAPKKDPQSAEDFIKSSIVEQIARQSLGSRKVPKEGQKAGDGFIVRGVGKQALERARNVFAGEAEAIKVVSVEGEYSLVVFAFASGRSFCLDDIQVIENEIRVSYHLMAHELMTSSSHFALIPLSKLPAGDVKVTMERSEDAGPPVIVARLAKIPAQQLVSGSFAFSVVDRCKERSMRADGEK